jgi:hypothetical protein
VLVISAASPEFIRPVSPSKFVEVIVLANLARSVWHAESVCGKGLDCNCPSFLSRYSFMVFPSAKWFYIC